MNAKRRFLLAVTGLLLLSAIWFYIEDNKDILRNCEYSADFSNPEVQRLCA